MTFRTKYQFEAARHLPVRWGARTWCPRITRLSPLFNSESSPNCRPSRRTPEVVCVWRRLSKPAPGETDPWRASLDKHSVFPRFVPTTH